MKKLFCLLMCFSLWCSPAQAQWPFGGYDEGRLNDAIGTDELKDDDRVPMTGDCVIVFDADTGELEYGNCDPLGLATTRYDQILNSAGDAELNFNTFTNTWTTTIGDDRFFFLDTPTLDYVIRGDGNVGIGSRDPSSALDVVGAIQGTNVTSGENPGHTHTASSLSIAYDDIEDPDDDSGINFGSFNNTWTFSTGNPTWTSTLADGFFSYNGSTGNVGVGTDVPTSALEIIGDMTITNDSPSFTLNDETTGEDSWRFAVGGDILLIQNLDSTGGAFVVDNDIISFGENSTTAVDINFLTVGESGQIKYKPDIDTLRFNQTIELENTEKILNSTDGDIELQGSGAGLNASITLDFAGQLHPIITGSNFRATFVNILDVQSGTVGPVFALIDTTAGDNDYDFNLNADILTIANVDNFTDGFIRLDHLIDVFPSVPDVAAFTTTNMISSSPTVTINAVAGLSFMDASPIITWGLNEILSSYTMINFAGTSTADQVGGTPGIFLFRNNHVSRSVTTNAPPGTIVTFDHRGVLEFSTNNVGTVPFHVGSRDLSIIRAIDNGTGTLTNWISHGSGGESGAITISATAGATVIVTNRKAFQVGDVVMAGAGGTETLEENYALYSNDLSAGDLDIGIFLNGADDGGMVIDEDGGRGNICLGEEQDSCIEYDGTNLVIDPDVVGSGDMNVIGGVDFDESVNFDIETITATDTLDGTDYTFLCDATSGDVTINLPAVSGITGRTYNIKKTDSSANSCTVDGNGSETIDGFTTVILFLQNDSIPVQSNGTSWFVL